MSRHRNIRSMDYNDEYDGYDDVYGRSADDDHISMSPSDAQQWIYDRNRQRNVSAFMGVEEENDEDDDDASGSELGRKRLMSEDFQMPDLGDEERARLLSCMEEIRNVVGESVSENRLTQTVLEHDFDCAKALDAILNLAVSSAAYPDPSPVPTTAAKPTPTKPETSKGATTTANLNGKFARPATNKPAIPTTVVIVATTSSQGQVRKGFEPSASPLLPQSPAISGRATPEIKPPAAISKEQSTRNAQQLFDRERGGDKEYIHLVVIGHVDAGKSTLMGHTLFDLGEVPQRVMHKYEQESRKMGKQSFMYAWVLDETGEERERGITMDVGSTRFSTESKVVTLLDAPGHKDFIPNMISGATQADVALLVVDATRGEFETGFEQGGQTREHAVLVRSLGVSQLGIVVNKMDTVGWSQERFDEIVGKLRLYLKQAGFKENDVTYVPCSGLTGENLVKTPTDPNLTSWYKGPTLISVIDHFRVPERNIDKPLRMTISDIFKGTVSGGLCIAGRIETGVLAPNDKLLVCPLKEVATVKSVSIDDASKLAAFAGDHATVTLSGIDVANIAVGHVLCDISHPVPISTRIQARIVVFNVRVPITIGTPVLLHHQSLVEAASISKLTAQLHKQTGEVVKKNPRCLGNSTCALVVIETTRPICVERYADCKELGRVTLRIGGVTVAAGLITKVLK